jgi:putative transposase
VEHLQRVLGISQRLACRIVGQHRSTQRHQPTEPERDRVLRAELRQLSRDHPRWGYRRAHAVLDEQGWRVNRKAIQRLWREEGLRVPVRHTREALTITVDRRIDADATVAVLDAGRRARPATALHPNGQWPGADRQRRARLVPLYRCWDQLHRARVALVEPLCGELRQPAPRRAAGGRAFSSLLEARMLVEDWRIEYNTVRPHSALGYMTPADYAKAWTATHPALS